MMLLNRCGAIMGNSTTDTSGSGYVMNPKVRRDKLLSAAEGYLMLEMPQQALDTLFLIRDPENSAFAFNYLRGMSLRQMGEHASALSALESAQEQRPDQLSLLLALAWCYKRTDQLERAISTMEHAYQVAPTEAVVLYNLACYWALQGDKPHALSWLGRALRLDHDLCKLIPEESDFNQLRDDPDFEHLVTLADGGATAK